MRSVVGLLCGLGALICACYQPAAAASAQAVAQVEVVSPGAVRSSFDEECARLGVRMSATQPELITAPGTVAKFDVIGCRDRGCSIMLPPSLDVQDSRGRKVADCSFSLTIGDSKPDSDLIGVVITADLRLLRPKIDPCSVNFDVIVAYD